MIRSPYPRRLLTLVGVVAALGLGFASIQVASAWTAASAPLTVAPDSVSTLQSRLSDEQSRSAALQGQLDALESQSTDLASALRAAHARIDGDASHAADLAAQLKTARQRLAKLEAAIAAANRASLARAASATIVGVTTAPAPPPSRGEPGDDHWGGGDD
jgi:DNA repair exonuclease SbcCD ATPase subunit